MKFSNGRWLMRKGVTPYYTNEARDIKVTDREVTVYAPFQQVHHRGNTLRGPLFTLSITSPAEDVISLRIIHFKKKSKKPVFDTQNKQLPLNVSDTNDFYEIGAGKTAMRIYRNGWKIEYMYKGKMITYSGFRGLGMMDTDEGGRYMCENLNIGIDEKIYGLGERFTPLIRNGQTVDIWNEDGGTGSEQSYKNIPFYLSNKGYGLFVNDPGKVSFEIGSEKVSKVQFSVAGEELEYMFIPGDTPKEILSKYTDITGKPGLPPAWSFGLWLTTSFTTDYDEETVTSFVDGMLERDIPLHTFHFDCFWMNEYEWCNFTWDSCVFPDPYGMIKRLKAKGLHICVWINPYIGQKSPLYDEGLEKDYFIRTTDGNPWQWDLWQPGMAIVDFTNPKATAWYVSHLEKLLDMGVDSFKTDFGERIPTENIFYHDGSDPVKMHNYYAYLYNRVVYDLLEKKLGKYQSVLFARSGSVGSQKFPVHWGGDCTSQYESMAESLRGGLSLSMSGFGFWSHDIGGFESTSTSDVYKRWAAFGLLSSHSRLHGSNSYRVPWLYDEESVDVLRSFVKLKCRLMPYLYSQANMTAISGIPMMRSMFLEHPEDPIAQIVDRQYYLGDAVMVAPVFNPEGDCQYYLPHGTYTHLLTNEKHQGGKYFNENFNYFSLPLYVKPNTILPMGQDDSRPDYDYLENISYHVFEVNDGAEIALDVYNTKNQVEDHVTLEKTDNTMLITRNSKKPATIVLRNIGEIEEATVPVDPCELGVILTLGTDDQKVSIQLKRSTTC
ncbi:alpha-xylosidase [Vallitalea pronyensis]|uniref:alpha-D-xyloside xylohydrolase n=1 Tax=Vallitalea pronyensis TaxID=1348613 RepID=A0A8J8MPS3_9FIRM|nr:alpha-xylosidase [Vallitalea pronyensis]QUI25389.1 alpha-xylosidase [Vallitalea pronyensis]